MIPARGGHIGLSVTNFATASIYDCDFDSDTQSNVALNAMLIGTGNTLNGGTYSAIGASNVSRFDFHGDHILNGGPYTVRVHSPVEPLNTMDLTDNYWGTSDPAQIDAWIYDNNDDSNVLAIVNYQPFFSQPVPTEESSFGQFKARFGSP